MYKRQVLEYAGCTILGVDNLKQLLGLVDEFSMALTGAENGMVQDIGYKRNIGLDATDMYLPNGAGGTVADTFKGCLLYTSRCV